MLQSQMGSWPEQEVNPKFTAIRTVALKAQGGSLAVLVKHAISWLQPRPVDLRIRGSKEGSESCTFPSVPR